MGGHNSDCHCNRYKPERAFTITKGRTIISNSKNEIFATVEYRAPADMTLEEHKDWNELSMGLFQEKKFTNPVSINSKIKRRSMWPIGWRKAMTKAGSFKQVADGWFHKSMEEFNERVLPAFSATLMNNNPPEAFSSALTFTTSKFQNGDC
ncbi:hypothetical protein BY996DRAFT_6491214 [Phakopsora pachyrhizi]|nr:hypothetical protein BY996DRAFT_6491214 [Phakopsora pachyrhizi]